MKKFIDDKGRLFGKVNLIDLLVVLLVVAVAAAAVIKITGSRVPGEVVSAESDMKEITFTVLCRMVHNDIADNVMEVVGGEQLMSNGELVESCFVTDVQRGIFYESYVTPEGVPAKAESEEYCDLHFTVSGQAPYYGNSFHVGSQEVRVGKSHIFKTVSVELNGTVVDLEGIYG